MPGVSNMSEVIDAEVEDFLAGAGEEAFDEMDETGDEPASAGVDDSVAVQAPVPAKKIVETRRQQERRYISWRVALVCGEGAAAKIFYGKACDITLEGMSFRSEHNISFPGEALLLLEIPAVSPQFIGSFIEIRSQQVYAVLSGGVFQIGLKFNTFIGNGRSLLTAQLH